MLADAADLENEANLYRQAEAGLSASCHTSSTESLQGAAAPYSPDEDIPQAKKCVDDDDEMPVPAHMMSYKARMNDLNIGSTSLHTQG